jgi:hypothetical protein
MTQCAQCSANPKDTRRLNGRIDFICMECRCLKNGFGGIEYLSVTGAMNGMTLFGIIIPGTHHYTKNATDTYWQEGSLSMLVGANFTGSSQQIQNEFQQRYGGQNFIQYASYSAMMAMMNLSTAAITQKATAAQTLAYTMASTQPVTPAPVCLDCGLPVDIQSYIFMMPDICMKCFCSTNGTQSLAYYRPKIYFIAEYQGQLECYIHCPTWAGTFTRRLCDSHWSDRQPLGQTVPDIMRALAQMRRTCITEYADYATLMACLVAPPLSVHSITISQPATAITLGTLQGFTFTPAHIAITQTPPQFPFVAKTFGPEIKEVEIHFFHKDDLIRVPADTCLTTCFKKEIIAKNVMIGDILLKSTGKECRVTKVVRL